MSWLEVNRVYNGEALAGISRMEPHSVDLILCDLPYATTDCVWDAIINPTAMWREYERVLKPGAPVVLTSTQPFTSMLVLSKRDWFRYQWVWRKNRVTGYALAKIQPLRCFEDILVFCEESPMYNPQGLKKLETAKVSIVKEQKKGYMREIGKLGEEFVSEFTNYPRNVIDFDCATNTEHSTQKPVPLFEYLIRTYTKDPDDCNVPPLVLDNCMGSGTTAIAAINTGRRFIGFEMDTPETAAIESRICYFDLIQRRIREAGCPVPEDPRDIIIPADYQLQPGDLDDPLLQFSRRIARRPKVVRVVTGRRGTPRTRPAVETINDEPIEILDMWLDYECNSDNHESSWGCTNSDCPKYMGEMLAEDDIEIAPAEGTSTSIEIWEKNAFQDSRLAAEDRGQLKMVFRPMPLALPEPSSEMHVPEQMIWVSPGVVRKGFSEEIDSREYYKAMAKRREDRKKEKGIVRRKDTRIRIPVAAAPVPAGVLATDEGGGVLGALPLDGDGQN